MREFYIFILITVVSFASICGFFSSILILDGTVESIYPFAFMVVLGAPSIFYLRRLTNLSCTYWTLIFPVNGFFSGLIWGGLPTYNDGLRILSVAIFFLSSTFFINRKKSVFLEKDGKEVSGKESDQI